MVGVSRLSSVRSTTNISRFRYYVFTATGATQWDYPAAPPSHQPSPTEQPHYAPSPVGPDGAPQDGDRGLGKTALALGGGLLAASNFKPLGQKVGAKMAGFFGSKPQPQQQNYQSPAPQVHVYPVYMPGPPGASPPPYHGQSPPMDPNYSHYAAGPPGAVPPAISPGIAMNSGGPGGFQSQSGPPLYIYGAVFADNDVTQVIRSLVTPQQTLTLSGDALVKQLGDPWPEAERKQFSVLYAYGDRPMELVAAELAFPPPFGLNVMYELLLTQVSQHNHCHYRDQERGYIEKAHGILPTSAFPDHRLCVGY